MLTVAVLRGGPSDEHAVSLKTGATVLQNLDRDRYRPLDVFIDTQGVWHVRGLPMTPERALLGVDVVWNALHGAYGEDGTVQRILDRTGAAYTGAGALGSALTLHKHMAKEILEKHGVTMPQSLVLTTSSELDADIVRAFRSFPQPSVVKPASSGSSVGVTVAKSFQEFSEGVKKAFQHSARVVVEEFIRGKDATVGVIDHLRGKKEYVLPAVEILPRASSVFFDYEAKYSGESEERVPGNFSRAEVEQLEHLARLAHTALSQRHYSRSDFRVDPNGRVYYLETNSAAGVGMADPSNSLLMKSLAAVGVGMPEFLDHVINLARHNR